MWYVLDDLTLRAGPEQWARTAIHAYHTHRADRTVVARNFGGAMAMHTIQSVDRNVPVMEVVASRGKAARAEPIAALYEKQRVHHVGVLADLEDQLINHTSAGYVGDRSPDRADALVWALSELSQGADGRISGHDLMATKTFVSAIPNEPYRRMFYLPLSFTR